MSSEAVPELLPVDSFFLAPRGLQHTHPTSLQQVQPTDMLQTKPFSVGAMNNLQHLLDCLQPIIGIHWLDRVRECLMLSPLEFFKFVMLLKLWHWLLSLSLLHVHHSLLHGLQHMCLHDQYLLQCWRWRRVGIVVVIVLIGGTIASVGHLMVMKRFEIEIDRDRDRDRDKRFPSISIKA
jgi:hypothetical protein